METVVVARVRNNNQSYGRSCGHPSTHFKSFGSPPMNNFRGIDCRNLHSGAGLLRTPLKSCTQTPVMKRAFSSSFSPQTPSPSDNADCYNWKKISKSSSIQIPVKINFESSHTNLKKTPKSRSIQIPDKVNTESKGQHVVEETHFPEHWAGPIYSNSPPPSSLPMPKFHLRSKRTGSLDLPTKVSNFDFHPIAKSAPASPTRECSPLHSDLFENADSATKTLRRILNIDVFDE